MAMVLLTLQLVPVLRMVVELNLARCGSLKGGLYLLALVRVPVPVRVLAMQPQAQWYLLQRLLMEQADCLPGF